MMIASHRLAREPLLVQDMGMAKVPHGKVLHGGRLKERIWSKKVRQSVHDAILQKHSQFFRSWYQDRLRLVILRVAIIRHTPTLRSLWESLWMTSGYLTKRLSTEVAYHTSPKAKPHPSYDNSSPSTVAITCLGVIPVINFINRCRISASGSVWNVSSSTVFSLYLNTESLTVFIEL